MDCLKKGELQLYKTGRTNANDGGIDFVMKPLGRFFQVTEVSNFDKYLLDIDKVVHYPITFVVKSNKTSKCLMDELIEYVKTKYSTVEIRNRYFEAVEEVITIVDLNNYIDQLSLEEVANFAKYGNAVASLCVEKRGAIPAMPSVNEIQERLDR